MPAFDLSSLRVDGFSVSSFTNNYELSTKLGHICFITDYNENEDPICFKSYKSKRVVRSAMAGEVIAFSELFDCAATLAADIGDFYRKH